MSKAKSKEDTWNQRELEQELKVKKEEKVKENRSSNKKTKTESGEHHRNTKELNRRSKNLDNVHKEILRNPEDEKIHLKKEHERIDLENQFKNEKQRKESKHRKEREIQEVKNSMPIAKNNVKKFLDDKEIDNKQKFKIQEKDKDDQFIEREKKRKKENIEEKNNRHKDKEIKDTNIQEKSLKEKIKLERVDKGVFDSQNILLESNIRNDNGDGEHKKEKKHKSHKDKSQKSKERYSIERTQENNKEERELDDYEDDFENYEDDFEDYDAIEKEEKKYKETKKSKKENREMTELQKAIEKENISLTRKSYESKNLDDEMMEVKKNRKVNSLSKPAEKKFNFFDFASAKKRNSILTISNKSMNRANALLKLIELDYASFDFYDKMPINEYDLSIMTLGRSKNEQVYVQTGEDNIDREIQTEIIDYKDASYQHPFQFTLDNNLKSKIQEEFEFNFTDPSLLNNFLQRTISVMTSVLEENSFEYLHRKSDFKTSNIELSDVIVELKQIKFLKDRPVLSCKFSSINAQWLLALHASSKRQNDKNSKFQGVISLWNVYEPDFPNYLLVCQADVNCCCFSPYKHTLIFAGMVDGSVLLWDLQSPQISTTKYEIDGISYNIRHPTYNTAICYKDNHESPIVSIVTISSRNENIKHQNLSNNSNAMKNISIQSRDKSTFQLVTLEMDSFLNFWVLVDLKEGDMAGSDIDLGICPGGKLKLIRSSQIKLECPWSEKKIRSEFNCYEIKLMPNDNTNLFISTNMGYVIHSLSYSGKISPKYYQPEIEYLVDVTSIDFSPFNPQLFLVGYSDGTISLFNVLRAHPLISWTLPLGSMSIQMVYWSPSKPSIFFILDKQSILYIWNLSKNTYSPTHSVVISKKRVSALAFSNDFEAIGLGLSGIEPKMAVFLENSSAEMHIIKKEYVGCSEEEAKSFDAIARKLA